jgi:diphthine-ammonia ligase
MRVFVSWSGGKDCSFARYLAEQRGLEVRYLLNIVNEDGQLSWSHNIPAEILQEQSQAMGVPLIQHRTNQAEYETEFKKALESLKELGITGGVFGDIDFEPHRLWVHRVCEEIGIEPILPLWKIPQEKIMADFIALGFKAIVVVTMANLMDKEWLGRMITPAFISDLYELSKTEPLTLCGEAGEHHSLVIDGLSFKKRMELQETSKNLREGYWFLDIKKYGLHLK